MGLFMVSLVQSQGNIFIKQEMIMNHYKKTLFILLLGALASSAGAMETEQMSKKTREFLERATPFQEASHHLSKHAGDTALEIAIAYNDERLVKELLNKFDDFRPESLNKGSFSWASYPLHYAVRKRSSTSIL